MKFKSMRGREIDLAAAMIRHGEKPAVGNASMNARGDIIGHGGKVIRKHEDVVMEYHRANPKSVRQAGLRDIAAQVMTPAEAAKAVAQQKAVLAQHAQSAAEANAAPVPKRKMTDTE